MMKKALIYALCAFLLISMGTTFARADAVPLKECAHGSGEIVNETFDELGYGRNDSATHMYRWRQTTVYVCDKCGKSVTAAAEHSVPEAHVWNVTDGKTCAYCGEKNPCGHKSARKVESSGNLGDYVDNHNGTHGVTVETATYWFCDTCQATWGYETTTHHENFPHSWAEIVPGPILYLCEACGSTNPYECEHPNGKKTMVIEYYEYDPGDGGTPEEVKPMDNGDGTHNAALKRMSYEYCEICALTSAVEDYEIVILERHIAEPHQFKPDSRYCYICGAEKTVGSATLHNAYGKLAIVDANGKLVDYTGFEKFEGADFYFEHGIIRDDMDGLTLINGTWYNMQQGRFNTADGMVFFEGATFLVRGGVIDETQSGLIEYDGQKFVFSYGQFVSSLYGAWPDPISGRFVYIWAGQFYPITDLVSYDGQIFYFIDGYLATDFVGTVYDFNGTPFNVIYGQVY